MGQPSGLVASPRDFTIYCLRTVVDNRQVKVVVLGFEEVGSPSQASSIDSGSQSSPGYGILKCLTCLKLNINTNFLSTVT